MKIFISSTYEDLKNYRRAVRDAVLRLGHNPVMFEDFGSRPEESSQAARLAIGEADIFMGIYAHRYGFVPTGKSHSLIEDEFDLADKLHKPRLIFIVERDHPWTPKYLDTGSARRKLDIFLKKVQSRLVVGYFTSPADLAAKVVISLAEYGKTAQAMSAVPYQLPPPIPHFMGREREMDELVQELRTNEGALITGLVGMGGVGKTALALMVAHQVKQDYPDGQLFLDMRGEGKSPLSAADAARRIIESLNPSLNLLSVSDSEIFDVYRQTLFGKRALILLDNLSDAEQIQPLTPPSGSAIVLTSRNSFSLPGFSTLRLGVLTERNSIALLCKLCPKIEQDDAAQIAELCGYLPLAIQLAGAVLATHPEIPSRRYIQDLKERQLGSLTSFHDRQTGVDAAIQLTYDLLSPEAQSHWRVLSVFSAPFESSAASAVWGLDHTKTMPLLGEFVSYSLLDYDQARDRYFLHPLLAAFASSRSSRKQQSSKRYRHELQFAQIRYAEFYLNLVAGAEKLFLQGGEHALQAIGQLDSELANIEAAQIWASENIEKNDDAARLCNEYSRAGPQVLALRLQPGQWARWLEAAARAAERLGDQSSLVQHMTNAGKVAASSGDFSQSVRLLERALSIVRNFDDPKSEANIMLDLSAVYRRLAQFERAKSLAERARATFLEMGNQQGVARALRELSALSLALGEVPNAITAASESLQISHGSGIRDEEALALDHLGTAFVLLEQYDRAVETFREQLKLERELGNLSREAIALANLGRVYLATGKLEHAVEYGEQQLELSRKIGDRWQEGNALGALGNAYERSGRFTEAVELYKTQLQIFRGLGAKGGVAIALENLGNAYTSLADHELAVEAFDHALSSLRDIGDRAHELSVVGNLGRLYQRTASYSRALELYQLQLSLAKEIGDQLTQGQALWALSMIYNRQANKSEAVKTAAAALRIFDKVGSPASEEPHTFLLESLTDEDAGIRRAVIDALRDSVVKNDVRARIVERLADTVWEVRQTAVKALAGIALADAEVRSVLLARLDDTNEYVRQEAINALGALVTTDPAVRDAVLSRLQSSEKTESSLLLRAEAFFSSAGFELQTLPQAHSFLCYPAHEVWKRKFSHPIYLQLLIDKPLDRESVIALYESAKATSQHVPTVFAVVDRTPTDGGWIEIGALRAEGTQIVPIDDAVLQLGAELQREREVFEKHLRRFIGRRNLYNVRDAVADRLNFFGREVRANDLIAALTEGNAIAIFGLRKMGKSSLMQYLRNQAPFPVAYVDLEIETELTDLYSRILNSWQRSLRIRFSNFEWRPEQSFPDSPSAFAATTAGLMAKLEQGGYSPKLGLFVDEIELIAPQVTNAAAPFDFHVLERYLTFARTLRGLVQETGRLALLIAGVDPFVIRISRLSGQQNPFYQFFHEEYLGPISSEDTVQMIRNIGQQMGLTYEDDALDFVARVSGGHPFLARQLCSVTFESLPDGRNTIGLADLQRAAEYFVRSPDTAALLDERGLWGEVTDPTLWPHLQIHENKAVLTSLAKVEAETELSLLEMSTNRPARENSILELEKRAVLERLEISFRIQFGLFRNWIRRYQLS